MSKRAFLAGLTLIVACVAPRVGAAADYEIDGMHSGVNFKISHAGISWVYGRFDSFSGGFSLDPNKPAAASFAMTIKADSIDTNNKKRDEHLSSPDFFDVKQFPAMEFKSTAVRPVDDGYQVAGDFTMHGVTKPITVVLKGGRFTEFPMGTKRTGFVTQFTLKRSDFGIDKFKEMLGDEVYIDVSFEATQK
ncbi:MAG TPA: YceI family protein [Pirellulales bacterium]|nr:YceI family protein [Pirellulales bacterium]